MSPDYMIRLAFPGDVAQLPGIELAAARLLSAHAPDSVLAETTSLQALTAAQQAGRLWVAVRGETAVGFAYVELLEPRSAHLTELDVHPDHGRQGLGTRLVVSVCRWAARQRYEGVTLTTFRDVAWNLPFYARLGFEIIPAQARSPVLASILAREVERGLDPDRRVALRYRCSKVMTAKRSA